MILQYYKIKFLKEKSLGNRLDHYIYSKFQAQMGNRLDHLGIHLDQNQEGCSSQQQVLHQLHQGNRQYLQIHCEFQLHQDIDPIYHLLNHYHYQLIDILEKWRNNHQK